MFGSLGFTELILILVIVLIIFGAGKLPQLGEGVGKAIKGFKKSIQEAEAFNVDPQAQGADASGPGQPGVLPQIPQPVQAASVDNVGQAQPDATHAVTPEPVAAPSKV